MTKVLVLLALAAKLQAQSSSMILCDQASPKHCWAMTAPVAGTLSPVKTIMWGKSGGLLVGLASTDVNILPGSVVSSDAFVSVSAVANASIMSMAATPSTGGADISVGKTGTGTLLPLRFWRNPNIVGQWNTSNQFLVGLNSTDVSSGLGSIIAGGPIVSATAISNASLGSFAAIAGSYVALASGKTGTGPFLPLTLWTNNLERLRIDTSGNVGIGITPTTTLDINGVTNHRGNTTFQADNTYYIGTAAVQPGVVYGRAIQSQKFQYEDTLGGGGFWYSASTVSGPGASIWELVDTVGAVSFKIFRGTTNSFLMDGHLDAGVDNTYDLGRIHSFKDLRLEGSLINGVNTVIDGSRNAHFNGIIASTFELPATGSVGCLQASNVGVVTITGTPCAGSGGAPGGSSGQVQFNSGGTFSGNNQFFWDATNHRLGLGNSTPAARLEVQIPTGVTPFRIVDDDGTTERFAITQHANIWTNFNTIWQFTNTYSGGSMIFGTGNTDRITITAAGTSLFGLSSTGLSTLPGAIVSVDTIASVGAAGNDTSVGSFKTVAGSYVALTSSKIGTAPFLPLTFWTSGSERLRIDTSGNVSIPTITGINQCLQINTSGVISGSGSGCGASSILGSSNTWTGPNSFQNIGAIGGTFSSAISINGSFSGAVSLNSSEWQPANTGTVALGDSSHTFSSLSIGGGGIGIGSSGGLVMAGGTFQLLTGALWLVGSSIIAPSGFAPLDGTITCSGSQNIYQLTVSKGFVMSYACH